jgi:hypothetical protein
LRLHNGRVLDAKGAKEIKYKIGEIREGKGFCGEMGDFYNVWLVES